MSKTTLCRLGRRVLLTTDLTSTPQSWSQIMKNTRCSLSHETAPMTSFESLTSTSSLEGAPSGGKSTKKREYASQLSGESSDELSEEEQSVSLETSINGPYPTFSRSTLRYSLRSTEYLIAAPRESNSPDDLGPHVIESLCDDRTLPCVVNGQRQVDVYIPHRGDDSFERTARSNESGSSFDEQSQGSSTPRLSPSLKLARFGVYGNHEGEKIKKRSPLSHVKRSLPLSQVKRSSPLSQVKRSSPSSQVKRSLPLSHDRRTSPLSQVKRSSPPSQPFRSILKRESMAKFDTSASSDKSTFRQNPDRQTTFGPPSPTVSQQDEVLNVARCNGNVTKHLTKEDVMYLEYFAQNPDEVNTRKGFRHVADECPSCSFPITAESASWAEWWRRTMLWGVKRMSRASRRPSRLSGDKRISVRSASITKDFEALPRFESRMCSMTHQLFCSTCHNNDTAFIPFNIVSAWDFTELPVSKPCHRVITLFRDTPLISFRAIHPAVKKLVPELITFRNLRKEFLIIRRLFDRDAAVELSNLTNFHPANVQRKRVPPQPCAVAMSSYMRQLAVLEQSFGNRKYWLKNSDMFSLNDLLLIERYRRERGQFFKFRCCAWTPVFFWSVGSGNKGISDNPSVAEAWGESREASISPGSGRDELSVADSTKFLTDFVKFVSHWEHHLVECQLCGSVLIEVKKLQRLPR